MALDFSDIIKTAGSAIGAELPIFGWQASNIGSLHRDLFVEFRALDESSDFLIGVRGRILSVSESLTNNWDSRMEDTNLDNRLSSASAGLQAGLQSGELADATGEVSPELGESLSIFKGKTLITKASTQQIWTGSPPQQIDIEIEFKAISNSYMEVTGAYSALMRMATPMLKDSLVKSAKEALDKYQADKNAVDAAKSLLGEIPPDISVSIQGKHYGTTYKIDSISTQTEDKVMIDNTGNHVYRKVSVSLSSKKILTRDEIK